MKHGTTSKASSLPPGFPRPGAEREALIAQAPGQDRLPTPEEQAQWAGAAVVRAGGGVATVRQALAARRGRPVGSTKAQPKVQTTIRFDADVLAALKATGQGWQTRVNDAMREWVKHAH